MFKKELHNIIHEILSWMKKDVLEQNKCYFGGGTALSLMLNEYRESVDIDFLCSSPEGYRNIREMVIRGSLSSLFNNTIKCPRESKVDRYGVRSFVNNKGVNVKLEIVSVESTFQLVGEMNIKTGVPTLSRNDLFCQKLMANSDRGLDRSFEYRDIIDICAMVHNWGSIPEAALDKAYSLYGRNSIDKRLSSVIDVLSDKKILLKSVSAMKMEPEFVHVIEESMYKIKEQINRDVIFKKSLDGDFEVADKEKIIKNLKKNTDSGLEP